MGLSNKALWILGGIGAAVVGAIVLLSGGDGAEGKKKIAPKRRASRNVKARVFVSFAAEDARARDLFVGQARHSDTPWEMTDFSLHEPFDDSWKTRTRPRIKGCDAVVMLIGKDTHRADGALWEVKCAKEEGVPVFGVRIHAGKRSRTPEVLGQSPIINWTWRGIEKQLKRATRKSR